MTCIQQILVVGCLFFYFGNTIGTLNVEGTLTDADIPEFKYPSSGPGNKDKIRALRWLQRKREGEDLSSSLMEAGAEMGGKKGTYSCTACGNECSSSCGTRYFRICCFQFTKKKKSLFIPPLLMKLRSFVPSSSIFVSPYRSHVTISNGSGKSEGSQGNDGRSRFILLSTGKRSGSSNENENNEDVNFNVNGMEELVDSSEADNLYTVYGTGNGNGNDNGNDNNGNGNDNNGNGDSKS